MKRLALLSTCLIAMLGAVSAIAQTPTDETSEKAAASASPVAYVYVARPTHIDGFAVSSSGKLTAVPGSPFSNIALGHLSVTKKYLFGSGDDGTNIYTFSIAANGSLKQVAVTDPHKYDPVSCTGVGPIQLDHTGATLYNYAQNCDGGYAYYQAFKIESNGELQYVGNVQDGIPDHLTPLSFLGNNQFAYQTFGSGDYTFGMKRESSGELVNGNTTTEPPQTKKDLTYYNNGELLATDPTDHVAIPVYEHIDPSTDEPAVLATYTADSHGNLTTKSTIDNMPGIALYYVSSMSISPSGKLLATGQRDDAGHAGIQVFHFNGGNPITHFTGLLGKEDAVQFGWDSENHLYALSSDKLYVYTATTSSVKEASGSPYSIPEAVSVIVLSLK
jgi:hypothetical protein